MTHNMREALEVSDEVVALNHGRVAGMFDSKALALDRLNDLVSLGRWRRQVPTSTGEDEKA